MPDGPLLPLAALIWPLLLGLLAALPAMRSRALRLLPLAPLPALAVALAGPEGETTAPDLLLGVVLGVHGEGRLLLGMTAVLWLAGGIYAQAYMAGTPRPAVFTGFWCLTLSGNLGVFMAADVVTFYVAFAAVSLAAYALVVHEGTEKALRAGRIYLVLAVIGEACLLLAFMIGAAAADSLRIDEVRAAWGDAPQGDLAIGLMLAGFGLKAGLVPLHVWLPLAHPAAPTPASAVLSGAIVKAGIIGIIMFMPPESVGWGTLMLTAGIIGAFAGALLGLTQDDPKAVLAYSTVSQMGLVVALAGAAMTAGSGMAAVAYYALHHGLAKGALFLSVSLPALASGRTRVPVLVAIALVAASVAGLPLTGGALAKAAAKPGLAPLAETALTLSAVTTTLLLAWFFSLMLRVRPKQADARPPLLMWLPAAVIGLGALVLPWLLWAGWTSLPQGYGLQPGAIWAGVWPAMLGLALAGLAVKLGLRAPALPQGDLVIWGECFGQALVLRARATGERPPPAALMQAASHLAAAGAWVGRLTATCEARLIRWRWAGLALMLLVLATGLLAAR